MNLIWGMQRIYYKDEDNEDAEYGGEAKDYNAFMGRKDSSNSLVYSASRSESINKSFRSQTGKVGQDPTNGVKDAVAKETGEKRKSRVKAPSTYFI